MYKIIKRLFDVISALLLLVIGSPIFLVLSILIIINLGFPIFFTQIRTGMNMRQFKLIKFRTMTNARNLGGELLPDHERVTKFGCFLRSSSLDELPELINIIIGDMSVIGPRPLPPVYDNCYSEYEKKRFDVRGGLITPDSIDMAPIISWDKQLKYEADYAGKLSILLDIKIMIGVFRILLKRNVINYGGVERQPLNIERSNLNTN